MGRNGGKGRWRMVGIATSVLVLALVGSAVAGSGSATKSGSIIKVSKRALIKANKSLRKANRALRIARNRSKQQGPKGDTGPKGDIGPKGDTGAHGSAGVSGLEIVEAATPESSADAKEEGISCPAGKRVFGGGARVEGPALDFIAIDLNGPGSDTTWEAGAHEHNATGAGWVLVVYAICGNAS